MKLLDIEVEGFGKLIDKHIVFDEGMNIIYGYNEAGKTTLHALIKAMLFGLRRARGAAAQTDTYMHYKPWSGARYKASMRLEYKNHTYRITRDFDANPILAVVYDETDGKEVSNPDAFFAELFSGITEMSYDSTISIGQLKSASSPEMAEELSNFIVNMDTTGNRSLNAEDAKTFLNKQRDELVSQLVADTGVKVNKNLAEIKLIEKELEDPRYVSKVKALTKEIENISGDGDGTDYLSDNHFEKSGEVDNYFVIMKRTFDEFRKEEREGAKKRALAPVIIFAVLCLLFAGGAAYCYMSNLTMFMIIAASASIAFLILFIISNSIRVSANKRFNEKKIKADELLSRLGADGEIGEGKYEAAMSKLKDIKKVAIAVEDRIQQYQYQDILMNKLARLKTLKEEIEFLERAKKNNESLNFDIQAIDIALETIDELSETQKNSAGRFLNKMASDNIKAITDGAYTSMSIGNDLNVYLNTKEKMVPLSQVSSGTQDQIYLAVRLACAKLMQSGSDEIPLIFDDSFVNYDQVRLTETLKWLDGAYKGQKLIFTCHTSEEDALSEAGIEFNKVVL